MYLIHFSRPIGFNLPLEYKKLIAYCKSNNDLQNDDNVDKREIWICKPVGLSQGRGISIFQVRIINIYLFIYLSASFLYFPADRRP